MKAIPISNKQHSMYTFAIVQLGFDSQSKFDAAIEYMGQAYGPGIYHDRIKPYGTSGYRRNTGDNSVWYYTDAKKHRYYPRAEPNYKIYLTTLEQLTMVSLFVG